MCRFRFSTVSLRHLFLSLYYASYLVAGFLSNRMHLMRNVIESSTLQNNDRSDNGNNSSSSDAKMRKVLELSWDKIKMGPIATDSDAAAKEAHSSILRKIVGAKDLDFVVKEEDGMTGIFFVDLLLPSYDKKQLGEGQVNLYDEVEAVQYCISLANCFKGKSEIIVRDTPTLQTVTNVLNARERNKNSIAEQNTGDDVVNNEQVDASDSFRQKLILNWDEGSMESTNQNGSDNESDAPEIASSSRSTSSSSQPPNKKMYRLASLFGNTRINIGPDMASSIVQALRNNALAHDDEDNIIILNSIGKDEMIAVRALVTKYGNVKKIIFVNCKFQPLPRELLAAETCYSVLPLMAKKEAKANDGSIDPKVVVLRRYPKDWEIFVDIGYGYELAETVAVNGSNKRGLSMDLVAKGVARHLDFTSRR